MALRIADTHAGRVEGIPCGNPSFTVFKGVPYAAPPVGPLRFRPPEPPAPWAGVKKCDTFGPMAMQGVSNPGDFYQKEFFPVNLPMSEDCLYLNIWTPAQNGNEKYPVMLWIHGGAYVAGCGYEMEFDGEAFCKRGVILVTINYRLGMFGYFAHRELSQESGKGVSGNYGLLDQIFALKWVKDNIHAFGGDADNVTVFGQSAGGGSVQSLICSTLAKGLFHKAIVQSAAGIGTPDNDSLAEAENLGAEICEISSHDVAALKSLPAHSLYELTGTAIGHRIKKEGSFKLWFSPNVDGYVLPKSPVAAIPAGEHMDIPYMIGTVEKDHEPHKAFCPVNWGKNHIRLGRKPVYIYHFNHDIPGNDNPGAFHSGELWYIFGTLARCHRPMGAGDYQLSLQMTDYWTNFAKQGNPNGEGLPLWQAYTAESPEIYELNSCSKKHE